MAKLISFEPLRDFFQRRQTALLERHAHGVQLVTTRSAVAPASFFVPAPTVTATIEHQAQAIGEICTASAR